MVELLQIFLARLVLEVFGGAGAVSIMKKDKWSCLISK